MLEISLGISLACVLFLSILSFFLYRKKNQIRKEKLEETYDVKALLQDLLAGHALIEVRRIAPSDYFIRSPRDR